MADYNDIYSLYKSLLGQNQVSTDILPPIPAPNMSIQGFPPPANPQGPAALGVVQPQTGVGMGGMPVGPAQGPQTPASPNLFQQANYSAPDILSPTQNYAPTNDALMSALSQITSNPNMLASKQNDLGIQEGQDMTHTTTHTAHTPDTYTHTDTSTAQEPALPTPTGDVRADITAAAKAYGMDPATLLTISGIESNYGQAPDTKGSQYRGLFQLGNDEWRSVGGTDENRNDKTAQIQLGAKFIKQLTDQLTSKLGRVPTPGELYLQHMQGPAGATALITAPEGTKAVDAIAKYYKNRSTAESAITGNLPDSVSDPDILASDFVKFWQDRVNKFYIKNGGGKNNAG